MALSFQPSPGTVTVTNGSATITGTGTDFTMYRAGYEIHLPNGLSVVLESNPDAPYEAPLALEYGGTTIEDSTYVAVAREPGSQIALAQRTLTAMLGATEVLGVASSWKFETATADTKPADGYLRFNHAAPASVTEIRVTDLDSRDKDLGDWLDTLAGGQFVIRSALRPNMMVIYSVTAVVDSTDYRTLTVEHVSGVPDLQADEDLAAAGGLPGIPGEDGDDAYVYIAYASDDSGTGFTTTFDADLNYIAILSSETEIETPSVGDFAGLWKNYRGEMGINWREGGYDAGTAYAEYDAVLDNGSSWRALQATTGNAPPVLPTTSNAYWTLLAAKGTDGAGTGDVVGPVSSTDGAPVLFDGTTGKLIKAGAYASQGEAEAGTDSAKFMTPERTAQAIAALTQGYDPNTAVLALELAATKDGTVTLADGKADSFASAANIDAGNSSNYQFDGALDVVKPTVDPNGTLLLLHMDGTDASTTFTDSSYYARSVTAVGNAQIDTAQKKFGTASALFDGSGDRLSVADSADFDFGAGDFTIECFIRFPGTASDYSVCEIGTFSTGLDFGVGSNLIYAYVDGDSGNNITITPWATNTWYHIAASRDGNSLRTFLDGALVGTRDVTGRSISTSDGVRIGGRSSGALTFNGWIDEFRISNVARYTAAFAPPAAPLAGPAPHNMTVRSSARVAQTAPDTGRLAIQLVENEAITINTDVVAKYSRDDGVTFETATLSLLTADGSTKLYQDSNIDLSGQTSDTDMVWQIETANNVDVQLSGIVDQQK